MLYIHGGCPKTGTTSLQAALVGQQDALAEEGILYPDEWRGGNSHNGLARMLHTEEGLDTAIAELKGLLEGHPDRDIILSSESLFFRLREERSQVALLRLLGAAREVSLVTVAWTLRRLDDMVHSLYRQLTTAGVELRPLSEVASSFQPDLLIAGFRKVEDLVAGVTYVKYDADGQHNSELLRVFGLPSGPARLVERALEEAPRLNTSLSQKQAATILNLEELSARSGLTLDRKALLSTFRHGDFRFDDDRPWELMNHAVSRRLHEDMLQASVRCGFEPYSDFFGEAELSDWDSSAGPAPDLVSDEDLRKISSDLSPWGAGNLDT
ncbi:MAG TPA: hypothetical protein VK471_09420 [Solirubrobacterales bacterium]|nr:hypothetical protein [Solirubrobacterales bacterium]